MKDKIDINLHIAGVTLSLNVKLTDEAPLREAAKEINYAWNVWRERFAGRSSQEVMAMVTLLFASNYRTLKEENLRTAEMFDTLEQSLDSMLEQATATATDSPARLDDALAPDNGR